MTRKSKYEAVNFRRTNERHMALKIKNGVKITYYWRIGVFTVGYGNRNTVFEFDYTLPRSLMEYCGAGHKIWMRKVLQDYANHGIQAQITLSSNKFPMPNWDAYNKRTRNPQYFQECMEVKRGQHSK